VRSRQSRWEEEQTEQVGGGADLAASRMDRSPEDDLESLIAAGFERELCEHALAACGGNVEAALESLLVGGASMADLEDSEGEEDQLPEELERAAEELFTRPGYLQAALSALETVSSKSLDELVAMGIDRGAATLLKEGEEDVAAATAAFEASGEQAELARASSSGSHGISGMLATEYDEDWAEEPVAVEVAVAPERVEAAAPEPASEPAPPVPAAARPAVVAPPAGGATSAEAQCKAKYEEMDVEQLKRICEDSWLSAAGGKEEMVARLVEYEKPAGGWPQNGGASPERSRAPPRSTSVPAEESASRAKFLGPSPQSLSHRTTTCCSQSA
jgi:hypothetical protein